MNESAPFNSDIQALRQAADRGDSNSCRDATSALMLRLPVSQVVRLTRDFVSRRLPAFERQQPRVSWPRELIESVGGEDSSNRTRVWPYDDEFLGPGGNSFKKAVESLWSANLLREDARQCITELVNALSETIMAEKVEHWGARYPEEWALWYHLVWSDGDDPRKTQIQLSMMRDPDVKRIARAGWLEVADRLEAASRGG